MTETEHKAGTKVEPGTKVIIKLYGKYKPPRVKVPDVTGYSLEKAKELLKEKGLKEGLADVGHAR